MVNRAVKFAGWMIFVSVVISSLAMAGEDEDTARVYVIRTSRLGTTSEIWTFANSHVLALTERRSFAYADIEPGKYVMWAKSRDISALNLSVEAGETYFLRQALAPGFGQASCELELMNEVDGRAALARVAPRSELSASSRRRSEPIVAAHLREAQARASRR